MEKNKKLTALACQSDGVEAPQHLGRELHAALFPEEYDHLYDSFSEAKDRQRGKNPMNAEYVEKTKTLRARLGFTPFNVGPGAYNDDTYSWVMEKLRQGEEAELREIMADRAREALETEHRREQARQQLQIPTWLDQMIDDMLAGEKFSYDGQDRSDPQVIAFRIMGELFTVNRSGDNEPEFFRQIRRILPGLSEAQYQALHRHGMNEWMEAYGC
jgi:hypothetical protein